MSRHGFLMGKPSLSVKPTAQQWNANERKQDACFVKEALIFGRSHPSQSRGHSEVTVTLLVQYDLSMLCKSLNVASDFLT